MMLTVNETDESFNGEVRTAGYCRATIRGEARGLDPTKVTDPVHVALTLLPSKWTSVSPGELAELASLAIRAGRWQTGAQARAFKAREAERERGGP